MFKFAREYKKEAPCKNPFHTPISFIDGLLKMVRFSLRPFLAFTFDSWWSVLQGQSKTDCIFISLLLKEDFFCLKNFHFIQIGIHLWTMSGLFHLGVRLLGRMDLQNCAKGKAVALKNVKHFQW